jgi:hypothetical protein
MTLADRVFAHKSLALSVVGLAKNVGKTTTLNYLIDEASRRAGVKPGITSTGWDGEAFDSINAMPKPRIVVPAGCIVATTTECLTRSTIPYSVLAETGMRTSLGDVLIIQCNEPGRIEVAGPTTISGLCRVREMMKERGCTHIFFDGAINRKASSSPDVCDSLILATGMNAGYHLDDVKRKSIFWVEIYSLEEKKITMDPPGPGEIAILDNDGAVLQRVAVQSLREKPFSPPPGMGFLLIPGALTDELLHPFMHVKLSFSVVVRDATKLFISHEMLRRCNKRNNRIFLLNRTDLMAVTVNPMASSGRYHDAGDFLMEMASALSPHPVWDVVQGKGLNER